VPASIIALHLNCRFCDVESFIDNRPLKTGSTRQANGAAIHFAQDAKRVIVIDDSVWSGAAIKQARAVLAPFQADRSLQFGAVYVTQESAALLDFYLQEVATPRAFEWNLFHRSDVENYCVDIDGVLCLDPTAHDNDDGPRYRNFLLSATRLARPSKKIGHLVTSRLARYRAETEQWLAEAGVEFGELHMLDVPTAAERRRLGLHGSFKAEVYKSLLQSRLFIESESSQAHVIARLSGKPVLDFGTQKIVGPALGVPLLEDYAARAKRKFAKHITHAFRGKSS
jgi:uncharacterized HAD superfamily protein